LALGTSTKSTSIIFNYKSGSAIIRVTSFFIFVFALWSCWRFISRQPITSGPHPGEINSDESVGYLKQLLEQHPPKAVADCEWCEGAVGGIREGKEWIGGRRLALV
jgi:hypothetical protein